MRADPNSIICDLRKGDQKAFTDLFEWYYLPMCAFISNIIKDNDTVEDLVLDCFVKLWEERKSLDIRSSVRNYLLTLARNAAISNLRKNKVQQVDLEKAAKVIFEEDSSLFMEPDIYNRLYQALDKLPEQRLKILKMAVFEKKSYACIAEELGISVNTVKTQIARSYRFLKSELDFSYRSLLDMLFIYFQLLTK